MVHWMTDDGTDLISMNFKSPALFELSIPREAGIMGFVRGYSNPDAIAPDTLTPDVGDHAPEFARLASVQYQSALTWSRQKALFSH